MTAVKDNNAKKCANTHVKLKQVGPSSFSLFGDKRITKLAGEIKNHLIQINIQEQICAVAHEKTICSLKMLGLFWCF